MLIVADAQITAKRSKEKKRMVHDFTTLWLMVASTCYVRPSLCIDIFGQKRAPLLITSGPTLYNLIR